MKKATISSLALILSAMSYPASLLADPPDGGTPQLLTGILNEVESIDAKIDGLDSDDDNPLLSDILNALQGLNGGATISGAEQTEGLIADPVDGSVHDLVSLTGSGTFIAARMTKQGGSNDITTVQLIIDGQTIVGRTYAALNNWGMTQNNPFGVVLLQGNGIDTVTIGFPQPIKYENSLILRTSVGEPGIVQMIGTVIHGE